MVSTAHRPTRADGHPVVLLPAHHFARLHFRLRERLPIWVVYDQTTREYAGRWVTRMFITLPRHRSTRFVMTNTSLDGLRDALPPGLTNIGRSPSDPPEIVEVWL